MKSLQRPAGAMATCGCCETLRPSLGWSILQEYKTCLLTRNKYKTSQTSTKLHQKLHCEVRSPAQKQQRIERNETWGGCSSGSSLEMCWVGPVSQASLPLLSHSSKVYRSPTRYMLSSDAGDRAVNMIDQNTFFKKEKLNQKSQQCGKCHSGGEEHLSSFSRLK